MKILVIAYFICLVLLGVSDFIWLGLAAKSLYKSALGPLMAEKPNFLAATLFYLIYPIGVILFAVKPALETGSWTRALVLGLLFGFFNYATFNLTNLAVIRGWPASPLGFDLPWGTVVTGAVAVAGYLAASVL